jgi:hypothetical protein
MRNRDLLDIPTASLFVLEVQESIRTQFLSVRDQQKTLAASLCINPAV